MVVGINFKYGLATLVRAVQVKVADKQPGTPAIGPRAPNRTLCFGLFGPRLKCQRQFCEIGLLARGTGKIDKPSDIGIEQDSCLSRINERSNWKGFHGHAAILC